MALRLVAVLAVVGALLTGHTTAATAPESALRLRAFEQLLYAVAAGDEPAMWATLSRVSRRRLGPTLSDFRARGARGVHDGVAPFAQASHRVILNAPLDRGLGLVAVAKRNDALAVPVRRERGVWKVEIDPLFTVEPVRPLPGDQVLRRTQLSAEVSAPAKIDGAAMWFDGRFFLDARAYLVAEQAAHVHLGRGATATAERSACRRRVRVRRGRGSGERVGLYGSRKG